MSDYETPEDAANEQRIIEIVQRARGVVFRPGAKGDPYTVYKDGHWVGFATVTKRGYTWAWFDNPRRGGIFFPIPRYERWLPMMQQANVPLVFIVEDAAGDIRGTVIDGSHDGIAVEGGRTDRGDPKDVEPCFKLLSYRFEDMSKPKRV